MGSILERMKDLVLPRQGRRFVALDLDTRALRMVYAERAGDRLRVLRVATFPVPPGQDVSDVQVLGTFLRRCMADSGLSGASVLLSVPRSQAVLKPVSLPPAVKESEVAGMVQYQMETELPFPPEGAVIDFTIESHFDTSTPPEEAAAPGVNVLVAAVQRPIIEQYQRLAEIAGVRLLRLGLRPYADARCVEACTLHHAKEATAVVHVGADETEIDILLGGATVFSRSAVVKVPPAGGDGEATVDQAIESVAGEVARSLRSYQAVQRGRAIDTLLVAGGTGIEPQVAAELARRLEIPCRMFDPGRALGLEPQEKDPSAYISALGLAIGHAGVAEMPFDFLNPKRPPVRRDRRKVMAAVIGGGVAAVFAGGIVAGVLYLGAKQARVDALSAAVKELEGRNRQVAALAKPLDAVHAWVGAGRPWLDHWAYVSARFPACTDAYVTGLSAGQDGVLSCSVRARSSEAISELGRRLAEGGYGFEPGQVTTRDDPLGYTFVAAMKVVVKPGLKVDLAAVSPEPRPADDVSADPEAWLRATRRGPTASPATSGERPSTERPSRVRRLRGSEGR